MTVEYFKKDTLQKLKNSTLANLKKYRKDDKWLFESIDKDTGIGHDELNIAADFKNIKLGYADKDDFTNSKLIYNSLKHLTPFEASNEQFWTYLTHDIYWDYMKNRWSVDKVYKQLSLKKISRKVRDRNIQTYIRERYFFNGSQDRRLMRNGISRLWWYAYCSYDDTKINPYELTEILLTIDSDITLQIVERTFSRNKEITLGILDALKEYRDNNPDVTLRNKVRYAMKMLTARSGVNVLDFMTREEVAQLVFSYLTGDKKSENSNLLQKTMNFD